MHVYQVKGISSQHIDSRVISLSHTGEAIDRKDDYDDIEDSDSDNEDDNDIIDNNNTNDETKEKLDDDDDDGYFGRFFENLVDKLAVFKTRAGRAGLVHNFLRGLQILASAPLFSGLLLFTAFFRHLFMKK